MSPNPKSYSLCPGTGRVGGPHCGSKNNKSTDSDPSSPSYGSHNISRVTSISLPCRVEVSYATTQSFLIKIAVPISPSAVSSRSIEIIGGEALSPRHQSTRSNMLFPITIQ